MRLRPCGPAAYLLDLEATPSPETALRLRRLRAELALTAPSGVRDLVPGYASLLVEAAPGPSGGRVRAWLDQMLARGGDAAAPGAPTDAGEPAHRVVEVAYGDGADREELERRLGLSWGAIVQAHREARYTVAFLGFTPGFPYLLGLPEALHTPRRDTPRTRVPAGSVAIAGAQAGIYPSASPGGWWLVGRTKVALFDPGAWPPTTWAPGDTVEFREVPANAPRHARPPQERAMPAGTATAPPASGPAPDVATDPTQDPANDPTRGVAIDVVEAWPPSASVQAGPRWWVGHLGMAQAGALDPVALELANEAVGNPRLAPAVELVLLPLRLVARRDLLAAVAGGGHHATLAGRPVRPGAPFAWPAGSELALLPTRGPGATSYVALRGGLASRLVRGSRSTDLRAGVGGTAAALRPGTTLSVSAARAREPRATAGLVRYPELVRVRVHPGPQYDADTFRALTGTAFRVASLDRTGVRLDGPALASPSADVTSEGSPWGAVQLPADGRPIILLADRGRTGGYAKAAVVDVRDLWRLAQARPGSEVWLEPAPHAEPATDTAWAAPPTTLEP